MASRLRAESPSAGPRIWSPRPWSPPCWATTPSVLRNVPEIKDVEVVTSLLQLHGVTVEQGPSHRGPDPRSDRREDGHPTRRSTPTPAIPASRSCFCGPLLHAIGEAFIPDLGGCKIGDRPIDYHLNVLRQFGAVVEKRPGGIHISAPDGLKGAKISLPYPSRRRHRAGAADAPSRAEGITELSGAATEPEILDLIAVLQKMGAIIRSRRTAPSGSRASRTSAATTTRPSRTATSPRRGPPPRWSPRGDIFVEGATQRDMMTFLNTYRKVGGGIRRRRRRHPLLPPGRQAQPAGPRDGRAPRLHDRLAAAARRGADPGRGRVDRPRNRLREPLRLHRGADRGWAPTSRSTANASAASRAASASATSCIRP